MNNLELYDKFKQVPDTAKKQITGGRLKGMTDINPMYRIKILTEQFGPCGIGWIASIKRMWLENGANNEVAAMVECELSYKIDGEWSVPIQGIGGSMFVANEKNGLYTSDEAYKMAYTDAISVACKMLGIGADVYYEKDRTKYSENPEQKPQNPREENKAPSKAAETIELAINLAKSEQELIDIWKTLKATERVEFKEMIVKRKEEL